MRKQELFGRGLAMGLVKAVNMISAVLEKAPKEQRKVLAVERDRLYRAWVAAFNKAA